MKILKKNIFDGLKRAEKEIFEDLISNEKFKLERIISSGQSTPKGESLESENDELALLLSGSAELSFENGETIEMKPGDYVLIPAGTKHRVEKTDENDLSVWLALHY